MFTSDNRRTHKPTYIYGLVCQETDELRYVGKTIQTLESRLRGHIRSSYSEKRTYIANVLRHMRNHGQKVEIIEFEIVEPFGDWIEAEQHWIAYTKFLGCRLANLTDGGEGVVGYKPSAATVAKRAELIRTLWQNPEWRANQVAKHTGYKRSKEAVEKTAAKNRGRVAPDHEREVIREATKLSWKDPNIRSARLKGISNSKAGVPLSDSHKNNISASLSGLPKAPEHNMKVSAAMKGKPKSDAHKEALSKAQQIRFERERREREEKIAAGIIVIPEPIMAANDDGTRNHAESSKEKMSAARKAAAERHRQEAAAALGMTVEELRVYRREIEMEKNRVRARETAARKKAEKEAADAAANDDTKISESA